MIGFMLNLEAVNWPLLFKWYSRILLFVCKGKVFFLNYTIAQPTHLINKIYQFVSVLFIFQFLSVLILLDLCNLIFHKIGQDIIKKSRSSCLRNPKLRFSSDSLIGSGCNKLLFLCQ